MPEARLAFANAIQRSGLVPREAEIIVRDDVELGEAAAIHCDWPLNDKGLRSREITIQITAEAINKFREADPSSLQI